MMIQTFQKFSQSRIAKIFLAIVALSFVAFFGGGSFFRPHDPHGIVAQVGDLSIGRYELAEKVQHALAQSNESMTREELLKAGFPQMVLNQLIQESLLNLEGENLGITVSNEALRQQIHSMKAFQNEKGLFDRDRFTQILRANGLSEDGFIATMRQELIRSQLANAILFGAYLSDEMVDHLFDAQYQYRQASLLLVLSKEIQVSPPPSDDILRSFYKEHEKEFKTPELRTITAFLIDPALIAKDIPVSSQEIKALYEAKPEVYGKQSLESATPLVSAEIQKEKSIEKMHQMAQQLDDKIAGGATFEELAPTFKGTQVIRLEAIDKHGRDRMETPSSQLPQDKETAEEMLKTAFDLEEGADSPFVQARNGTYYTTRVDKIMPAVFQPFEEIMDRVLKIWLSNEQIKAAYIKAQNYVNSFNQGDRKVSLMTLLPNLSLSESSPSVSDEVKNLVFSLRPGQAGLARTAEGFAVVVLNTIIPPTQQMKEDKIDSFKEILLKHYQNDLLMSYLNALRVRYPVKVNKEAIKALFSQ